jgi:hypothetical protein
MAALARSQIVVARAVINSFVRRERIGLPPWERADLDFGRSSR